MSTLKFLPRMGPCMYRQLCGTAKTFSALSASKPFDYCVALLVSLIVWPVPESFWALITAEFSFSSVQFLVDEQIRLDPEAFPAFQTLKRALASVNFMVADHIRFDGEGLFAVGALIGPFTCVNSTVLFEIRLLIKSAPAAHTQVALFADVPLLMCR